MHTHSRVSSDVRDR